MGSQRAFTMLETVAALGIVTILLLAGLRMATLARAPGATANAAAQLDAAIALSRSLARASGNGATLLALPRTDARGRAMVGFRIVLYRGRPNAPGAATLARSLPLVADATLEEGSVGAPPFALFFRGDGSAVALAHPSLGGSAAAPQLATIAAEPPCLSSAGVLLRVTRNGATVTRSIPCPAVAGGGVAAPQASMTPNPPTLAPRALRFTWPSAPVQEFAIAEFGYRGWFAATGGAMQSFSCRANGAAAVAFPNTPPYSGPQSLADARSVPSPPNGVPYAFAASASAAAGAMDDAPALFPVQPVTAGLCAVPLVDAFGQRSDPWGNPLVVAMQVMGWLTLAANGGSATHNTAPLAIAATPLTSGQSVTVDASKTFDNDPAGIAFAGLSWSPASCGSALTLTASGNNTAESSATGTATRSFVITDTSPPSTALTCTGTITDQYGEPAVAFTTSVAAANATAFVTWPAYLEVGVNGTSLGQSGSSILASVQPSQGLLASLTARVSPWISAALGGGIADASPCVFNCATPAPVPTGGCTGTILKCPTPAPWVTPTPCPNTANTCVVYITPISSGSPSFTQTGQTWSFTVSNVNYTNGPNIIVTSSDPSAVSVSPATGTVATTFTLTAGTTSDPSVTISAENVNASPATSIKASVLLPALSIVPGPCYARALTVSSSGIPNMNTPDTSIANMPTTVLDALGSALGVTKIGVDSTGCIDEYSVTTNSWQPVPKFGGVVYEPSDTTKSFNVRNNSCVSNAFSGPWQPASQTGVAALLDVVGGSTGGSCTIDLTDGSSTSTPAPDAGQVTVGVVGACPGNGGILPIGQSCFPTASFPASQNPVCDAGGSESGPVSSGYTGNGYFGVRTSPTTGVIAPPTYAPTGGIVGPITRIGPGSITLTAFAGYQQNTAISQNHGYSWVCHSVTSSRIISTETLY